tara:strand:- start:653 stop:1045 length:393 start_codon:yes stop_codon:yes gene_type:complete
MLQQDQPEDFIISTGRMETVRRFIELSASALGWHGEANSPAIIWENSGINEIGKRGDTKEIVIRIDPRYFRPTEVNQLLGDSTKALKKLGWKNKTSLEEIIYEMIEFDKMEAQKESLLKKKGFKVNSPSE